VDQRLHKAAIAFNEGRLDEADAELRRVLAAAPELASQGQHIQGLIQHRRGDTAAGIETLARALGNTPGPAGAQLAFDLGRLCAGNKDFPAAERHYGEAVRRNPEPAVYWHRWGRVLARLNRREEAVRALGEAVQRAPEDPAMRYSLAVAQADAGDTAAALRSYETLRKLDPGHGQGLVNLGALYLQLGRLDEAEAALRAAAALPEKPAEAQANLGTVLMRQDRFEESVKAYQAAVDADPKNAVALGNASVVLANQVRHAEARHAIEAAVRANPSPSGPWDNLLFSHYYRPDHDPAAAASQARQWGEGMEGALPAAAKRPAVTPEPGRSLRVGLVSPDFCQHPVASFLLPLLRGADRNRMTLHAFAQLGARDDVTDAVRRAADGWHEIQRLNAVDAAALIRREKIDILIDLAGHTSGNRLDIFMQRPAPVQATWLGYPGTTGLRSIQYRLTDAWADPPGQTERFHTEDLLRLPRGFLCFDPPGDAPAVGPLPAERNGHVTFGSFNNLVKLNEPLIALWARVLDAVPGARLTVKSRPLGDEATRERVARLFEAAGVGADRVSLLGRIESPAGHLDAYNGIDIGLDTHPYNGTTTTCEALWMGVPVVTRTGASHVSRVSTSILNAIGRRELAASDADRYVALAAELAGDLPRLAALRAGLRDQMAEAPLTDARGFARDFEAVLRKAWRAYCETAQ
jgi:predicted O-linked N-acetylglucosamine transferase (SPINDLY family)